MLSILSGLDWAWIKENKMVLFPIRNVQSSVWFPVELNDRRTTTVLSTGRAVVRRATRRRLWEQRA